MTRTVIVIRQLTGKKSEKYCIVNTCIILYTYVIETCFGESCHLLSMSLVLKDLFPLGNNCSNLYENECFSIPLSLKC